MTTAAGGDEEEVGDRGVVDGESFEFFAADFGCDSHPRSFTSRTTHVRPFLAKYMVAYKGIDDRQCLKSRFCFFHFDSTNSPRKD